MWAVKVGDAYAINLDLFIPDWKKDFTEPAGLFDTNNIFNFPAFRKEENFKKMLAPGEDTDDQGNVGNYMMSEEFQIALLYSHEGDDHMKKVMDSIPHAENGWAVYVITF